MTQSQFEVIRDECGLQDARLGPSTYTDTSTLPSGGTLNMTNVGDPGGVSLFFKGDVMNPAMTSTMICISQQFERLGAEATLSPEP